MNTQTYYLIMQALFLNEYMGNLIGTKLVGIESKFKLTIKYISATEI